MRDMVDGVRWECQSSGRGSLMAASSLATVTRRLWVQGDDILVKVAGYRLLWCGLAMWWTWVWCHVLLTKWAVSKTLTIGINSEHEKVNAKASKSCFNTNQGWRSKTRWKMGNRKTPKHACCCVQELWTCVTLLVIC